MGKWRWGTTILIIMVIIIIMLIFPKNIAVSITSQHLLFLSFNSSWVPSLVCPRTKLVNWDADYIMNKWSIITVIATLIAFLLEKGVYSEKWEYPQYSRSPGQLFLTCCSLRNPPSQSNGLLLFSPGDEIIEPKMGLYSPIIPKCSPWSEGHNWDIICDRIILGLNNPRIFQP